MQKMKSNTESKNKLKEMIRRGEIKEAQALLSENKLTTDQEDLSAAIIYGRAEIIVPICQALNTGAPLSEDLIRRALEKFRGNIDVFGAVLEAVKRSKGISEKTLNMVMQNTWFRELMQPVFDAIIENSVPLSIQTLKNAIDQNRNEYAIGICDILIKSQVPVPEDLITRVLGKFLQMDVFIAILEAVKRSKGISEKTLNAVMKNLWFRELMKPVLDAIVENNVPLSIQTLKNAIDQNRNEYAIGICNILIKSQVPVPEDLIIRVLGKFSGNMGVFMAVLEAVKRSNGISEKTLNAVLKNPWYKELMKPVLNAIIEQKNTQAIKTVFNAERCKQKIALNMYFKLGGELTEELKELAKSKKVDIEGIAKEAAIQNVRSMTALSNVLGRRGISFFSNETPAEVREVIISYAASVSQSCQLPNKDIYKHIREVSNSQEESNTTVKLQK